MMLKASVAAATLAITLTAAAGVRAEDCPSARQTAQRTGSLPVVVEEYYPHSDRTPAPVETAYTQQGQSDDYGFPDFNYDPYYYDNPYTAGYGLGGYGYGFRGDGRRDRGWDNGAIWDNDRGGGHTRVSPGRSSMGRGGMARR